MSGRRRQFGTVRRLPSGRWQARYPDGAGRMVAAPETFATARDAGLWLDRVRTRMAEGTFVDLRAGARTTVAEWAADWLAHKGGQRAATIARDQAALRYVLPYIGRMPLPKVTPLDVRRCVEVMRAADLAPATIARNVAVIASLFEAALDAELIGRSPVRRKLLALPPVTPPARPHLEPAELVRLAAECGRDAALVLAAGVVGLRWGEAVALRPAAVDFLRRRITVDRVVEEVAGDVRVVEATKSDAGRRTIAVPAVVTDALAAHLAAHRPGAGADDLIFVGPRGGILRRKWVARRFTPAVQRAGLPSTLTFHGLRHVAATYLETVNAPLRVRQHRLGHAPQGVTLGVYTHVPDDLDRQVADDLGALFTTALVGSDSGTGMAREGR